MDCPAPGLRLESITPPWQEIMRIWRTLRPVDRFFIRGFTGDLTAYLIAFSGPIQHPRHPRGFYKSGRFTVNGILASYNASTSPSTPPTKSEHSPPHQHTWLSSTQGARCPHSGPRLSRSYESHLQPPRKSKASPKRPCAQSYSPSGRSGIDFAASLSTLAQKLWTTRNFRES
ncbi:hypothetical protein CDL15_Pgr005089 [Punica granatum]|uniref:Uncharacterized protein n=1 Tax=Punica granatum TaxID=22663 RepID=A0A218WXZ5_PUNGR|nr:hypothetical protein CDL15_Pgr005089 [Punica granatum]